MAVRLPRDLTGSGQTLAVVHQGGREANLAGTNRFFHKVGCWQLQGRAIAPHIRGRKSSRPMNLPWLSFDNAVGLVAARMQAAHDG